MRANTGPGKTEMMLVGALPFSCSESEAECFYLGRQVIGFVETYWQKAFVIAGMSCGKLIVLTGVPRLNTPWWRA